MWTEADLQRLKERVRRAAQAVHRPFVATGHFPERLDPDAPETGALMEAEYAKLVARGELQGWTMQDEIDLRDRVRRIQLG